MVTRVYIYLQEKAFKLLCDIENERRLRVLIDIITTVRDMSDDEVPRLESLVNKVVKWK